LQTKGHGAYFFKFVNLENASRFDKQDVAENPLQEELCVIRIRSSGDFAVIFKLQALGVQSSV
jgi:hypothetical protein